MSTDELQLLKVTSQAKKVFCTFTKLQGDTGEWSFLYYNCGTAGVLPEGNTVCQPRHAVELGNPAINIMPV